MPFKASYFMSMHIVHMLNSPATEDIIKHPKPEHSK